ncbi:hypothetical protein AW27_007860 [Streptomyces sp. PCS3-D2]|uniref:DUF7144 family membrane protein n=1 Tax=Streptomyces sp. PCS3-D2 TaxID=1460244 RepID=UPI0004471058|nr:hypothetical protein [Streptomyces sp. PCS3-D2]WKV71452.1 hypothetical protein AW27_007860 [Streptomyces sp. PCS3-D2]
MADHVSGVRPKAAAPAAGRAGLGALDGWLYFAGFLMVFGGLATLSSGISAIAGDEVFLSTPDYAYAFGLTGWGWVQLVLGVVLFCAGIAVLRGALWARVVGIVFAGLSMVSGFMWLPYAPLRTLVLLAVDGLIVWALCTAPRPTKD